MTPKTLPGDTKFWNKWKKWNITKTIVFTMFIARTATGFWHHFHPRITQNMDLETVSHFGTPNYRKIIKRCSKSLPRDSPNDPKITKNAHLDLQVPVGWPLGSLDHQNDHSRHSKWSLQVSKMTAFCRTSYQFSQSASQQFPASKGAGGRGEAFKYCPGTGKRLIN